MRHYVKVSEKKTAEYLANFLGCIQRIESNKQGDYYLIEQSALITIKMFLRTIANK